ncbi:hypothetical protein [Streptomyces sp. VRA16 Mangrove soil]|uniref:hypothetical protein n=1 Tax=Streptomyces sp. VRA16 Mangrove soil TaxID=2817434 RepID=UPI001A9F41C0|nr:hypothetical protein [Streptomyces sp. VRA16 Mangrove soil]MBO1332182.1 hypothetical protein [Streptomyces sp. VRA16 Mangrove soil]
MLSDLTVVAVVAVIGIVAVSAAVLADRWACRRSGWARPGRERTRSVLRSPHH